MLYNTSSLIRPYLVGFLVSQPLYAMLLHMALLATIMAFDGLVIFGDILTIDLSCFLDPFTFSL
jgi:hypothetical protein